jgi:hypothetical protein
MLAKIGEDAGFLDLLFEALERALKIFFVVDDDFGQTWFPKGRLKAAIKSMAGPGDRSTSGLTF